MQVQSKKKYLKYGIRLCGNRLTGRWEGSVVRVPEHPTLFHIESYFFEKVVQEGMRRSRRT